MAETEEEEKKKKKKKKKVAKKKKKKKVTPKQVPAGLSRDEPRSILTWTAEQASDHLEKLFGNTEKEDAKAYAANKKRFEAEKKQRELDDKQRRDWLEQQMYGATPTPDINKNKGGYVKKYAHGGGVRKTKISDY